MAPPSRGMEGSNGKDRIEGGTPSVEAGNRQVVTEHAACRTTFGLIGMPAMHRNTRSDNRSSPHPIPRCFLGKHPR